MGAVNIHTLVCDGSCCRDIFLWVTLSEQTIVVYSTGRKQISFLFICHIFVVSEIRNNSKNVLQDVSLNLLVYDLNKTLKLAPKHTQRM